MHPRLLAYLTVALALISFALTNASDSGERQGRRASMKSAASRIPIAGIDDTTSFSTMPQIERMGYADAPEDSFVGHKVGSTWYDYQHNGSMGRQIARGSDGRLHFSWTYKTDSTPGTSNRFVYYNSTAFTAGAWTNSHGTSGTVISGLRGGYTNIDVFNNRAIAVWHEGPTASTFSANVGFDFASGAGSFTAVAAPLSNCSGSTSNGEDGLYLWPIHHADSDTGSIGDPIAHIITCEETPADELLRSMIYFRSSGPGFTIFASCGIYIDSVMSIAPVVRQDPNSGRVAVVWLKSIDPSEETGNQYNNDVVYIESPDRGISWGAERNVTNYQPEDPERAFANLSAMYSSDGCFHIVWDAPVYDYAGGSVSTMADKLRHWDDCSDCISLIINADNFQNCLPGRWNYNATKENISECDGKLYVTYTFFAGDADAGTEDCSEGGYANGEIYVQASATGGLTWGPPVNLTNTFDDGCEAGGCESEHWSSSAMYTADSLYILYVGDTDAGGWAGDDVPEGTATESPMMFMTYPCFAMESTSELQAEPEFLGYPFHVEPGGQMDTTLLLVNSGTQPEDFTVDISYSSGDGWLSASPIDGSVPVGCENTGSISLTVAGPEAEGLYEAEVVVSFDNGEAQLQFPVTLYCFATFPLPEAVSLRTESNRLAVLQNGRLAEQRPGQGFSWFSDGSDFLFDASLIIGSSRDDLSMSIFHPISEAPTAENPWKRLLALSAATADSLSHDSYRYAAGVGCNHDSSIAFRSQYYAPRSPDSSGFYVAHYDVYPGPGFDTQIDNLLIAFATDWDIPSDSATDNRGGVNSDLQLVYQQGQYSGSSESNNLKYGGVAYRGDDSASLAAAGALVWENDKYVYPNESYNVDSLELYLRAVDGWQVISPDSIEDLSSVLVIAKEASLTENDTISFSLIIAASNAGLKSLADLESSVAMGEVFICDYVVSDAPFCPGADCFCGDADGNNTINISDCVKLIGYIFGNGAAPDPICLGDADGNTVVNIADVVYLIGYIFGGGPAPTCPE